MRKAILTPSMPVLQLYSMYSLPTLVLMFILFAFTSHSNFTAALTIGKAVLRPKTDHSDLSDLPEGKELVMNMVEREAINELDEDDVSGDVLMPARFPRLPAEYRCVYDCGIKRLRCFPNPQIIFPRQ